MAVAVLIFSSWLEFDLERRLRRLRKRDKTSKLPDASMRVAVWELEVRRCVMRTCNDICSNYMLASVIAAMVLVKSLSTESDPGGVCSSSRS